MTKIFIHHEFEPEAIAMIQALYSRSSESVASHVKKVRSSGSAEFMKSYYIGYGHASIGDCGTTTLFVEGVSILGAKAIQDNPLYSGQETSTRYIDFSSQPIIDPINSTDSRQLQAKWIDFYMESTQPLQDYLKAEFPLQMNQSKKVWRKAIKARAFDILRGYLPAGVTTQLSWATNLRQAHDKLSQLRFHPLLEVRSIASRCLELLKEKYPSSFAHPPNAEQDHYYERISRDLHYSYNYEPDFDETTLAYETTIDNQELDKDPFFQTSQRPQGSALPRYLTRYGRYNCRFLLDFGSFRDLQRHRNGLCRIPILNGNYDFNSWYIEQLPSGLQGTAKKLVVDQFENIKQLQSEHSLPDTVMQYYYPLGTNILCEIVYDLPEIVYVTELRSSPTVHPTLRNIAHKVHDILRREHPQLSLYVDRSEDTWRIQRGLQDIEKA